MDNLLNIVFSGNKKFAAITIFVALAFIHMGCRPMREVEAGHRNVANKSFYDYYSQKLGYTLKGTEDPDLLREVSAWLGTPHRMGGATKLGADCSGFVSEVFRSVYGVTLPRTSAAMALFSMEISPSELRDGDLVFFITRKGAKINHVGIYLSNDRFIHVSSTRGVMVSTLNDPYFVRTFYKAGRVR